MIGDTPPSPPRNRRPVQQAVVAVIAAGGCVEEGAVVPHEQHAGLPFVAILERLLPLMLVEFNQQRHGLCLVHALKADDIAKTAEQSEPPGFGVRANIGVMLGGLGRLGGANIHRSLRFVALAISAVGRIGPFRRMDRHAPLNPGAQGIGHGVERRMLVGEQRVTADGRNFDAIKACARRWSRLKAPVAVPGFGEQRRSLIGQPLDRDHMRAALDRGDEGIVTKAAKSEGEAFEIVVG